MNEPIAKPKILFVDDEQQIIDGIRRIFYPFKNEWDIFYALSGEEALKIIDGNTINVVVTDMRMPGMNGAELLYQVKKRHPETIRIILSGHSDEELIMRSVNVAHQFLLKPCETNILIETIRKTFYVRVHLRNENLIKLINGIEELPEMPEVIIKIEDECSKPSISINKVASLISEDIGLTVKILQVVNSAFFGLPAKISDLEQAVSFLGLNTVRALILFLKLHRVEFYKADFAPFIKEVLQHSLIVANYTRMIYEYETKNIIIGKEAFAAGMLHDVGKLVLLKHPEYKALLDGKLKQSLHKIEYEKFNVTHADVGAYLLAIWNIPNNIVEAVAFHHNEIRDTKFDLCMAVNCANRLANLTDDDSNEVCRELVDSRFTVWKEVCGIDRK